MNDATGWIALAVLIGLMFSVGDHFGEMYAKNQKQEQRR